ncbi:peptidoglycan-binding domain-containing protein [Mumia sp. DW29H23]|uniref:peptidoglycan-binding domain-containing protein n=1 Tax=Mumia sp. DW29H23 TaxID=3421241 RepID=UPI003D689E2D
MRESIRHRLRRTGLPATSAALALGLIVGLAGPAAADGSYSGRAYVYGAGTVTDDFGDEGVVSQATNRVSNATCLWQTILWANGYLPSSGIDGAFGAQTAAATEKYQRDKGLTADGSAGRNTWSKADSRLFQRDNQSGWLYLTYEGLAGSRSSYSTHQFVLQRSPDGNYRFYPPSGGPYWAGYNSRTC